MGGRDAEAGTALRAVQRQQGAMSWSVVPAATARRCSASSAGPRPPSSSRRNANMMASAESCTMADPD
ncbi:MAG: hypothetical protein AMK73_02205 [Planctomycetes bacterium SM23_32]|nr:MAG: hypothetical protein AMK73_02205 [Planctomycetes bacterium SM23_32]